MQLLYTWLTCINLLIIKGGIGGLAHQPIQALISEGASTTSVVGSVGRGLVGVITKPIGGAADLLVHTGQGFLQVSVILYLKYNIKECNKICSSNIHLIIYWQSF